MGSEPNMSPSAMREWRSSGAYEDYKEHRDAQKYDGYTYQVWARALRVIEGEAHEGEPAKVRSFIARHKTQGDSGERRFGSGPGAVSARTAALRNWGYDPTGRYS